VYRGDLRQDILGGAMRFDNQHSVFIILAATLFALGGCRPGAPGSGAVDSVTAAARGDSSTISSASAPSARSDSVVLRTDKSQYRAGDKITLTFENRSAASYSFNPCTRTIEREENGTWTALPDPGRMCTMQAFILDAHGTSTGTTELPTPLTAGRYRVVVRMTAEAPGASASPINAVSDPITVS
jgi:hypothetical protein